MNGTFMVSLDFELFWGMLDVCALEAYQENVLGGKKAIPQLLKLFEKYGIHATWATVGFLFAENYEELSRYFPEQRPGYLDKRLDAYAEFAQIGKNEEEAPCFYAPSLVRLVAQAPGQEIGSHTFCHYYCREKGQTVEEYDQQKERPETCAEYVDGGQHEIVRQCCQNRANDHGQNDTGGFVHVFHVRIGSPF